MEDERSFLDDFARELEAAAAPPPVPPHLSERVLLDEGLAGVILSFLPVASWPTLAPTCLNFDVVLQRLTRRRTSELLSAAAPLPPPVASAVEAALWRGCGRRAGPGAYNDKLRGLLAGLRANSAVRERLASGRLLAVDAVRLTAEGFITNERAEQDARVRERAIAEARVRDPPADLVGVHMCSSCGSVRQWVRRHMRHGLVDKFTELLVCCDCRALVARDSRAPAAEGLPAPAPLRDDDDDRNAGAAAAAAARKRVDDDDRHEDVGEGEAHSSAKRLRGAGEDGGRG
jgi:hypothetical protein